MVAEFVTEYAESIVVGILGLVGVIYTAWRGSRGERRGQDWQRITDLWKRVDRQDERINSLEKHVDALQSQNTGQAAQISRLERWRDAALTYIASLLDTLRKHDIEPPEPPDGYVDEHSDAR